MLTLKRYVGLWYNTAKFLIKLWPTLKQLEHRPELQIRISITIDYDE